MSPVERIIESAITDPGQFKKRHALDDEPSWQAAAVIEALASRGYGIVPAARPGSSVTDEGTAAG